MSWAIHWMEEVTDPERSRRVSASAARWGPGQWRTTREAWHSSERPNHNLHGITYQPDTQRWKSSLRTFMKAGDAQPQLPSPYMQKTSQKGPEKAAYLSNWELYLNKGVYKPKGTIYIIASDHIYWRRPILCSPTAQGTGRQENTAFFKFKWINSISSAYWNIAGGELNSS